MIENLENNCMIENLKNWNLTQEQAGFYDIESGTVIQQTARLYQKIKETIDILNNYLDNLNEIVSTQNSNIEEATNYMKNNIQETASNLFNEYLDEEKIEANLKENYNSDTEELTLSIIESRI